MANFIRNVVVEGVTYAVGDKRIEGDNFAYIQIPEAITVGTNLTDLAPIQKALDSTDGAMLYVPSLNALFSPTASTSPTVRIWSSTVGDKGYQLKATLDASGVLQSAVVNEASAEAGLIITDAEWTPVLQQYLGKDPADFDSTGTYLITNEAKAIADKLVSIDMAAMIISAPDKFQIEIKNMYESMVNCVSSGLSMDDNIAGYIFNFKTLGNITYLDSSGQPTSISLDTIGAVFTGGLAGLVIKEPQTSEDYTIDIRDLITKTMTGNPYTFKTTPEALALAQEIIEKQFASEKIWLVDETPMAGIGASVFELTAQTFDENSKSIFEYSLPGGLYTRIKYDFDDEYNPVATGILTMDNKRISEADYRQLYADTLALTTGQRYVETDMAKGIGALLRYTLDSLQLSQCTDNPGDVTQGRYTCIKHGNSGTGTDFRYVDTYSLIEIGNGVYSTKLSGTNPIPVPIMDIEVYYKFDSSIPGDVIYGIKMVEPTSDNHVEFNISTDDYKSIKDDTEGLTTDPYVTTDLAKSIGKKLLGHFKKPEVRFDIDHFTVSDNDTSANGFSPAPISFYTYVNNTGSDDDEDIRIIKFATTAEIYNGDITVFYNKSNDQEALGMRIDPKSDDCVKIAKKYMEVEVDPAPIQVMQKEITVSDDDTLNINSVLISIDVPDKEIIHYPASVILKGDDKFALEFKIGWNTTWTSGWYGIDKNYDSSTTYLEYSYDGKTWANIPKGVAMTPIQSKVNDELNGHAIFIRGNSSMYARDMEICKAFITSTDATYVDILGDIAGICPEPGYNALQQFFANNELIRDCSRLKMHTSFGDGGGAYIQMFLDCVNLIKPPVLPATELCDSAYDQMFSRCTSLTSAPVLPATILGVACYGQMFKECTALVNAPTLIAKNIPRTAYTNMFEGCTALVVPPTILAESVDSYGCQEMFKDCISLKRCPDLLFTTLTGEYCCLRMFEKCTSLTRPVNLYPTSIASGAYNYMYDGCTGIKWGTTGEPYRIPCVGEGTAVDPASFAQFMFIDNSGSLPEGNGTPKLNTTYYFGSESNGLLFTSPNAFTVALVPDSPYTPNANFKISKDGETWEDTTWDENNGISLIADTLNPNLGEYSVYIKGDNHFNTNFDYNSNFLVKSGDNISVSGDLDELWGKLPITDCECAYMFVGMTQLINAENLRFPEETASSCYYSMFADCDNLVNPPALLPAKRIGSAAYYYMFNHCTSLTKAPVILGDTICTTDDRPEHVQGSQCFCMFNDTGITEIPTLLFNNFELNDMNDANEGNTFCNMFSSCPNLTNISGVLMPAQALPHSACDGMFEMCDNLVSVSSSLLPATTLGEECYYEMFNSCTSLTNTPQLPATVLESSCYERMFKGCVALTKPSILPTLTSIYYSMSEMYLGCSGIKWAASGTPYEIKVEGGSTDDAHTTDMFKNNTGALPEGTGTPKLNTVYYLAV